MMEHIHVVVLPDDDIQIIQTGYQGPPGGVSAPICGIAGEKITTGKIVYVDEDSGQLFIADFRHPDRLGTVLGVSITEAEVIGAQVQVVTGGVEINHPGAIPGKRYFLGIEGGMTTDIPVDGICQEVGVCLNAEKVWLVIGLTIRRHAWE